MSRTGDSKEVVSRWDGGWRARVDVGGFSFLVDEPAEVGGTGTGPMPTEYLLGSLASCYTLALAWAARRREVTLTDLEVRVVGEYDGPRYRRIRLVVHCNLDDETLKPLLELASRACYVSNTLARPPEIEVTRGEAPSGGACGPCGSA